MLMGEFFCFYDNRKEMTILMMNSNKKSTSLPNETVDYLKAWMMSPEHIAHPYPTDAEKSKIMQETGIELKQLTNWFVNNRKRYWKPRVEAKLQEHVITHPQGILPTVVTPEGTIRPKTVTPSSSRLKLPRSVSMVSTTLSSNDNVTHNGFENSMVGALQVASDTLSAKFMRSSESGSSSSSDLSNMTEASVTSNSLQPQQASSGSLVDSVYVSQHNSDDEDSEAQMKSEVLDVHILRPIGKKTRPELGDVSILPFLPKERVARTFKNCLISYDVSVDINTLFVGNEKLIEMMSLRRESKIIAMKQQCLLAYQAECEIDSAHYNRNKDLTHQEDVKRKYVDSTPDGVVASRATKFRRVSVDMESSYRSDELPTIEEAAQLFGFAQAIQQNTAWTEVSP
jgi:Homeobox KN domain